MKRIVWGSVGVLVIGFLAYRIFTAVQAKRSAQASSAGVTAIAVEVGRAGRGRRTETIRQNGTISARSEITIYSKVPGKLAKNLVAMNDRVAPGQVVALVDRDEVGFDFKQYEAKTTAGGIVARVPQHPGATVGPNTPLVHIVEMDSVKALVAIPEEKIRLITKGHAAAVTVEAYPGETFRGTVTAISPVANPANRTVEVEIGIRNPSLRLKPGMYARAELVLGSRMATLIPLSAVTERGGKKVVFTVRDSTAVARGIVSGPSAGDSIEVFDGLAPGEEIVVVGTQRLNDGDRVAVKRGP